MKEFYMSGYKMKIAICGKSGLVGSKLEAMFTSEHGEVIGLSIRVNSDINQLSKELDGIDVLINLSGATILARWSDEYKQKLYKSRIDTTKKLVDAMKLCSEKPKLFLSASAVGIYDSINRHEDDSNNYADDFLSNLCQDWESEANKAHELGIRTVECRFGVIYAKEGGAMAKMLPPFRFGLGGKVGSGMQMVSWIHIDDLTRAIEFIIKTPSISGSVNFTSPKPLTNIELTAIMGKILNRPTIFDVPGFVLKLIFGEGSSVMLDSKEVYPTKLLEAGFTFDYVNFEDALRDMVR